MGESESQTDGQQSTDGQSNPANHNGVDDSPASSVADEIPIVMNPTIKPTLIWLGLVVAVGTGSVVYFLANPHQLVADEFAGLIAQGLSVLTVLAFLRFFIRVLVLRRTTYSIDGEAITREYSLLYRTEQREVPFSMVRSHQLSQSRIERLLGFGTIRLNQGLGMISIENVPNPKEVRAVIDRIIENKQ